MVRAAVERAAGRREQPLPVLRTGDHTALARRDASIAHHEAAVAHQSERIVSDPIQRRVVDAAAIAVRRSVDEQQQPLGRALGKTVSERGRRARVAVLRADIDGRRAADGAAAEHRVELVGVVVAEEHRVVREREAVRRGAQAPGYGRQRAVARCGDGQRAAQLRTQCAAAERADIAVEHDGVRRDLLSGVQHHTRHPTLPHHQSCDMRVIPVVRALLLAERLERERDATHAALHQPDALLLDMGDQHQRRGCGER